MFGLLITTKHIIFPYSIHMEFYVILSPFHYVILVFCVYFRYLTSRNFRVRKQDNDENRKKCQDCVVMAFAMTWQQGCHQKRQEMRGRHILNSWSSPYGMASSMNIRKRASFTHVPAHASTTHCRQLAMDHGVRHDP